MFGGTAVLALRARKPTWSQWYNAGIISGMSMTGYVLGSYQRLSAHVKYLHSIQDRSGYAEAIKNIETRIGITNTQSKGPCISLVEKTKSDQDDFGLLCYFYVQLDHAKNPLETHNTKPLVLPGSATMNEPPPPQTQKALGKWDEIRKASSNSTPSSSWDALRQDHEKQQIKNPTNDPKRSDDYGSRAVTAMVDTASETREPVDSDKYAKSGDRYSR